MADINAITALLKLAHEAVAQDDQTPEDDRLSARVLLAEAIPMLEEFKANAERNERERRLAWHRNEFRARQNSRRKGY